MKEGTYIPGDNFIMDEVVTQKELERQAEDERKTKWNNQNAANVAK